MFLGIFYCAEERGSKERISIEICAPIYAQTYQVYQVLHLSASPRHASRASLCLDLHHDVEAFISTSFSCPMSSFRTSRVATSNTEILPTMVFGSALLARRCLAQASCLCSTALQSTVPRNWFTIVLVREVLNECIRPALPSVRITFWICVTIFQCQSVGLPVLVGLSRRSFIASSFPLAAAKINAGSSIIASNSGTAPCFRSAWIVAKSPSSTA